MKKRGSVIAWFLSLLHRERSQTKLSEGEKEKIFQAVLKRKKEEETQK